MDDDQALIVLNSAITNKVEDDRILLKIADIKYRMTNWAEALDLYFLLYEKNQEDPQIIIKYLNTLIVLNEQERLNTTLQKISGINNDVIFYRNVLTFSFDLTEPELLRRDLVDLSDEQTLLLSAIKDNNIDPAVEDSYILGLSRMVYHLLEGNYPELALQFDRKLINENSFFEKPNLYAGSIYVQLNAPDHAIAHINRCLKYNPESIPCHILMIETLYMQGDHNKVNENILILTDLLSQDIQDQAFYLYSIIDRYKDYNKIIEIYETLRSTAPNYYREIDFVALRSAFLIKDINMLEQQVQRVGQFENILIPEEQSLYLASKILIDILQDDVPEIDQARMDIIKNTDPGNIYTPLTYYFYYFKISDPERMEVYKQRAIELDLNKDIPDTFYL